MDFSISISVIMPTYNTETEILKEAVDSILNQTLSDFEFLIIDDGTTNESTTYLNSITDKRVKIIRNPSNIGITKSLNIGLKQAQGKYIARMDADDVSLPSRFEKEYAFMETHTDVIVCGSMEGNIINGEKIYPAYTPKKIEEMEEYRVKLLFLNPGPRHPTAMIRHEQLILHNILYDENLIHAQDYGLWETISHYGKIVILNEVLLLRRKHVNQITVSRRPIQIQCDKMTQKKILTELLGNVTDQEEDMHYIHSTGYYPDAVITQEVNEWYNRLIEANKERHIYDQRALIKRIMIIKKRLIQQSFKTDMSLLEKMHLVFGYLPFYEAFKMIVRICIPVIRR